MELCLFKDLLVILGLSIVILLIGHRLRIPPVVGFILTGVLSGPHGLRLINQMNDVATLAQIGIVLLLFGIGLEFSIKKLLQVKQLCFLGGFLQVGLTVFAGCVIALVLGRPWGESIFLGCLLSMSSTAVVLRLLEQREETASPQGRLSISILIFQDIIAVPIILLIPFLGDGEAQIVKAPPSIWLLAKGVAIVAIVFFSAQRIIPRFMLHVARTRNKELFLLTILTLCFGVAWLTFSLGLSLTIGAFLAGLIISESEYSHETIGHIFPFQALFVSFFFISIGMLLDVTFFVKQPFTILAAVVGILLLKIITGGLTTILLGMPIRTAVLVGIALSQIGEFSFVLAKTGIPYGLGSEYHYQLFLAIALLSLAISPVLINLSHPIADWVASLPLPRRLKTGLHSSWQEIKEKLENHLIIVGFGVSGKNLARSSKLANINYTILEMNPDTVKEYKILGESIHFGDAAHPFVLEHVNIRKAKALAVLINDPIAARQIVQITRQINPSLYIIVRARYVQDIPVFFKLGANEIIPDEFGTSIEVFSRVLQRYGIPQEEIENFIDEIRAESYGFFRDRLSINRLVETKMDLLGVELNSIRLYPHSPLVGKSLLESELRKMYGLTVLLIRRGMHILANPTPETVLNKDDIVVLAGENVSKTNLKKLSGKADQTVEVA